MHGRKASPELYRHHSGTPLPYRSCPGQGTNTGANTDLFFFTLFHQPNYLDYYNNLHNGGTLHALPYNSQFKCYGAMHIWNQLQPAPYDGEYFFPSVLRINPTTGRQDTAATTALGGVGVPVLVHSSALRSRECGDVSGRCV